MVKPHKILKKKPTSGLQPNLRTLLAAYLVSLLPMKCNSAALRNVDHHRKSTTVSLQWWKKRPRVRNKRPAVKPSPRILHSSPAEEKKFHPPFSENGPSDLQGEGATSAFSYLREWEGKGVTTPIVLQQFKSLSVVIIFYCVS